MAGRSSFRYGTLGVTSDHHSVLAPTNARRGSGSSAGASAATTTPLNSEPPPHPTSSGSGSVGTLLAVLLALLTVASAAAILGAFGPSDNVRFVLLPCLVFVLFMLATPGFLRHVSQLQTWGHFRAARDFRRVALFALVCAGTVASLSGVLKAFLFDAGHTVIGVTAESILVVGLTMEHMLLVGLLVVLAFRSSQRSEERLLDSPLPSMGGFAGLGVSPGTSLDSSDEATMLRKQATVISALRRQTDQLRKQLQRVQDEYDFVRSQGSQALLLEAKENELRERIREHDELRSELERVKEELRRQSRTAAAATKSARASSEQLLETKKQLRETQTEVDRLNLLVDVERNVNDDAHALLDAMEQRQQSMPNRGRDFLTHGAG